MKISVVTPVYNGEKFIRQTVESILSQTGDFELEYIVCDGKSTDNTLKILEEYKDRCTIISQKDGSPQVAINNGMAMATGEIGCWLNADDLFEPGTLQKVVDTFKKYPNIGWIYGRCCIIDEKDREIRKPVTWYKNILGYFYSRNVLLCENYINQPATFWRMDIWRKANDLSPEYKAAWDYELWLKMSKLSKAKHLRCYLSKFRRHDSSISENNFEKQFTEELAIAKANGNFIHWLIHKFNVWKIISVYQLLNKIASKSKPDDSLLKHTFVVPAFKDNQYLEECINSLKNQTIKSKIIITTSTPSPFLKKIAHKHELKLIENHHPPCIANDWNFALSQVDTPYCTIAHQDDLYDSNYTAKMLHAAKRFPASIIFFSDYSNLVDRKRQRYCIILIVKRLLLLPFFLKNSWHSKTAKKFILSLGCPICCPSVLYNLKNLKDFHFTDDYQINLDWNAWYKLSQQDYSFTFVPHNLVAHRISPEAETSQAIKNGQRKQEDLSMFQKIWGKTAAQLFVLLYSLCYHSSIHPTQKSFKVLFREGCYYIVGGLTTMAVCFGVALFLVKRAEINYIIANNIATFVAWIWSYFINKYFVFRNTERKHLIQGSTFIVFQLCFLLLANIILYFEVDILKLPLAAALIILAFLMAILNFTAMKLIIFKKQNNVSKTNSLTPVVENKSKI